MGRGKLKPGSVMALTALILGALVAQIAVAGGASGGSGKTLASTQSAAARVAKKSRRGPRGPQGPPGPQGIPGQNGTPGAQGSARAYAWVRAGVTPSLDPNRTTGFTAVAHPGGHTGYYCLTLASGINALTVAPIVSVAWSSGFAGEPEFAHPVDPSQVTGDFACTGNAVEVLTLSNTTATPTNSLDFTIAIP